jgi:hypothetical protein
MMLVRLKRGEDGFALVTAMAILAVMTLLLVVVLAAGNNAFTISERNARYVRTLGVAEAGLDDVVTQLGQSGAATNPCAIGTSTTCTAPGGQYQVAWTRASDGTVTISSVGYYPQKVGAKVTRKIQAVYQPVPVFNYALFSQTTLTLKNGQIIYGDMYANQSVSLGTGAVICGSIFSAGGDVLAQNGANVVKSYTDSQKGTCTGKAGNVWAGGSINLGTTGVIQGDATASGGPPCPPVPNTLYSIQNGTVQGKATACGIITAATTNPSSNTKTDPPAALSMPTFTWDPNNYSNITCIPISNPCNYNVTSDTAYTQFNALNKAGMKGVYAAWQNNPHCTNIVSGPSSTCTALDLSNLSVSGDLTIVTNAPITFGNTSTITSTAPAKVIIVSLYIPSPSSTCDKNGGDCSIFGVNSIVFDSGNTSDPNDGIAAMLYTPGKCAFKNSANGGDGAIYCGSMDISNGYNVTYNGRVSQIVGFGGNLQQVLWQEVSP